MNARAIRSHLLLASISLSAITSEASAIAHLDSPVIGITGKPVTITGTGLVQSGMPTTKHKIIWTNGTKTITQSWNDANVWTYTKIVTRMPAAVAYGWTVTVRIDSVSGNAVPVWPYVLTIVPLPLPGVGSLPLEVAWDPAPAGLGTAWISAEFGNSIYSVNPATATVFSRVDFPQDPNLFLYVDPLGNAVQTSNTNSFDVLEVIGNEKWAVEGGWQQYDGPLWAGSRLVRIIGNQYECFPAPGSSWALYGMTKDASTGRVQVVSADLRALYSFNPSEFTAAQKSCTDSFFPPICATPDQTACWLEEALPYYTCPYPVHIVVNSNKTYVGCYYSSNLAVKENGVWHIETFPDAPPSRTVCQENYCPGPISQPFYLSAYGNSVFMSQDNAGRVDQLTDTGVITAYPVAGMDWQPDGSPNCPGGVHSVHAVAGGVWYTIWSGQYGTGCGGIGFLNTSTGASSFIDTEAFGVTQGSAGIKAIQTNRAIVAANWADGSVTVLSRKDL